MLLKDAIEEVTDKDLGFYPTFFLIPQKGEEWDPILNLKGLSRFIHPETFRMLTPQWVLPFLKKED